VVAAAAFVIAALVSAAARSHVPGLLLTIPFILVVLTIARFAGAIYALPVGVVSIEAFDWYFLPPTRTLGQTDAATILVLGLFVMTAVLVGAVADRAGRRADASEEARGVLADEQAALRRVATLVARQPSPAGVFAAVTEEAGKLLGLDLAQMLQYEDDGTATVVAGWGRQVAHIPVGTRLASDGESIAARIFRTWRPVRIASYAVATGSTAELVRSLGVRSAVGGPIVVHGRLWGYLTAGSVQPEPVPEGAELRIGAFTELVATAISNAEVRAEVTRLAEEQAALRRVATLVARAAQPAEVFAAVTEEVGHLLPVDLVALSRYEADATVTVLAGWREQGDLVGLGTRPLLGGPNVSTLVWQTGRAARMESYDDSSGDLAALIRETGIRSAVGAPISVEGRLWGVMIAASTTERALPRDAEARLSHFTDLVATALANAEARAQLTVSRARVVAAADETRRRLERDLHDGIQQRLVSIALEVRAAKTMMSGPADELEQQLSKVVEGLGGVLDELREISRGIHPAILSEGGLAPALKALARRSRVPVRLDLKLDCRLDDRLEVAAYYVASEALANAAKHANASVVELHVHSSDDLLTLSVRDDGVGGADPGRGSGLVGLTDRVEALGGTISVVSPAGDGTSLQVRLPRVDRGLPASR
jgi:signal transduction histidine kinase